MSFQSTFLLTVVINYKGLMYLTRHNERREGERDREVRSRSSSSSSGSDRTVKQRAALVLQTVQSVAKAKQNVSTMYIYM